MQKRLIFNKILYSLRLKKISPPDVFILGAQKSGTTFLYHYLNHQKNIRGSEKKEIDFFSSKKNFAKGMDWYLTNFIVRHSCKLTFESCPNYMYTPDAIKRIYEYNPKSKLIILLRNPTNRFVSSWKMHHNFWKNDRERLIRDYYSHLDPPFGKMGEKFLRREHYPSLLESIRQEIYLYKTRGFSASEPGFLTRGLYANQIKEILQFFNYRNLLFIETMELRNLKLLSQKISEFLSISIEELDIDKNFRFESKNKIQVKKEDKQILSDFFAEPNEELYRLIGTNYNWT